MVASVNASTSSGVVVTSDLSGQLALQANGVTVATASSSGFNLAPNATLNTANTFGMKNRIINGAMVIDQRNAGASVTIGSGSFYTLDRWNTDTSQASKFSIQQNAGSVTPPAGYSNYLGVTSLANTSLGASDYFQINQKIEGFNTADLGWGTANAKTVTLSFQVYSSLTGTFGGALKNSAQSRSYPFTYSIPVANTWTSISITVAGDTSGTWIGATNGIGLTVNFGLGIGTTFSGTAGSWSSNNYGSATGAVSVVGTNGATFYITGVQLEVGTQATSFDFRPYGTELALCQRYYETSWYGSAVGVDSSAVATTGYYSTSDSLGSLWFSWRVTKRTQPTAYIWSPLTTSCANKIRQANNGTIVTISSLTVYGNVASFSGALASLNYQLGWSMDAEL
jgi:hypothetical protein